MGVSPEPCQKPSRIASESPTPRRKSGRLEARSERWSGIAQGRANIDGEQTTDTAKTQGSAQSTESLDQDRSHPQAQASATARAMDSSDEKAAEARRAAQTSPDDVFMDAPTHGNTGTTGGNESGQATTEIEDPEKDALRKEIQNKHLSLASEADARKRESIETPPRWSTVLSDSDAASEHTIQGTPVAELDGALPATRSRVTLQVPEGEHDGGDGPQRPTHSRGPSRGGQSAAGVTVASSRRSLPSLRRRETKLMQKKSHPWQHLGMNSCASSMY